MKFLAEWSHLMLAPVPWLYRGVRAMSDGPIAVLVITVLSIAGFTVSAILWQSYLPVPWWSLVLGALFFIYLGLTAGLAWEKSRGATVGFGPVDYHAPTKTFLLQVTNGERPARISLVINSISAANGNKLTYGSIHLQPRTQFPNNPYVPRDVRHYPICTLSTSGSGYQRLTTINPDNGEPLSISGDAVLSAQPSILFHILVTSESQEPGRTPELKTYSLILTFTPDSSTEPGYRITIGPDS